jgi:hypothetical protein
VVGINSFHSNGQYNDEDAKVVNDGVPHVVFQFQNIPVLREMNANKTNAGGYAGSEMRKYLLNDEDANGTTGRTSFLQGLVNAGVPKNVMWAPLRYVSTPTSEGAADTKLSDLLWLPTKKEILGTDSPETATKQARLEYYTDTNTRKKYSSTSTAEGYWLGSYYPERSNGRPIGHFYIGGIGTSSAAAQEHGVAPAFCVSGTVAPAP